MLVALEGAPGSGVSNIADTLCSDFKFTLLSYVDSTPSNNYEFNDAATLLDYITTNWLDNMVIYNISSHIPDFSEFMKRPFVLLVTVDSSIHTKFERSEITSLSKFCEITDDYYNSINSKTFKFTDNAKLHLINNTSNQASLLKNLKKIDLLNVHRLRPDWDSYFMSFTDLAAMRSNCMKRKVGCVIVKDNRVLATGYNGTPRGFTNCNEGGCYRCNHPLESGPLSTCLCLHAEENALLEAGRSKVETGSILYCNTCPCLTCSIKIVQVGIKEVIYSQSYNMDQLSKKIFTEAGVTIRQFTPPSYGTIILE